MGAVLLSGIVAVIIIIIFAFISIAYKSFILGILGLIIAFIAVLYIYKTAFNVGWGVAFVVSILAIIIESILISILYVVTMVISIVNTPVGTMEIGIIGIIGGFMLGLLLSTIFIYLIAKRLNINISFLATSIINLFPGIVSFIIP